MVDALVGRLSRLENENKILTGENEILKEENGLLVMKNSSLLSDNQSLTSKNQSLTSENFCLRSENQILTQKTSRQDGNLERENQHRNHRLGRGNSDEEKEESTASLTNDSYNVQSSPKYVSFRREGGEPANSQVPFDASASEIDLFLERKFCSNLDGDEGKEFAPAPISDNARRPATARSILKKSMTRSIIKKSLPPVKAPTIQLVHIEEEKPVSFTLGKNKTNRYIEDEREQMIMLGQTVMKSRAMISDDDLENSIPRVIADGDEDEEIDEAKLFGILNTMSTMLTKKALATAMRDTTIGKEKIPFQLFFLLSKNLNIAREQMNSDLCDMGSRYLDPFVFKHADCIDKFGNDELDPTEFSTFCCPSGIKMRMIPRAGLAGMKNDGGWILKLKPQYKLLVVSAVNCAWLLHLVCFLCLTLLF